MAMGIVRKVDLNAMNGEELSYLSELIKDLAKPTNVFAIRILEYLTPEARHRLICNLINQSADGTVFFITTHEQR